MESSDVLQVLSRAVEGRRLLDHPFYRRWEAGDLAPGELGAYAEQYRHVETALPEMLTRIVVALPDGPARSLTAANLAEERDGPVPHVALFEQFARAVGASSRALPTPATAALLDVQVQAADSGPVGGLAALAVYEMQAPDVAASKAAGLRAHYGLDGAGTEFWDVHATLEAAHACWLIDALSSLDAPPPDITAPAVRCAQAWWSFLDEREAAAPAVR